MHMKVKIEKFDNEGRGICYIDDKITFVPNTLPEETVDIKLIKENKKYNEAVLNNIVTPSSKRITPLCPYFNSCGGCDLLHLKYDDVLKYKETKIKEIFSKYLRIDNLNVTLIKCEKNTKYRNKVVLHIKNGNIGFYDAENNIINIENCLMISDEMNRVVNKIRTLNIFNGNVLIRENNKGNIIVSIDTEDNVNIDKNLFDNLVFNGEVINGDDYFEEEINNYKFKVSYKSFFQINREMTSKLFDLIEKNVDNSALLIDLYCGVGTLGIVGSTRSSKVIGIDNMESNIEDALENKRINDIKNIEFELGDSSNIFKYKDADTIIVDPPRNGLNKNTLKHMLEILPNKILYVSCDPFTLCRDLSELLSVYNLENYYLLDMFSYTHHIESFCILTKK